ncbi:MAG: isoprenylcysteine carboxylmethyltransferase family protein, partial [Bacteroidota bacterium]
MKIRSIPPVYLSLCLILIVILFFLLPQMNLIKFPYNLSGFIFVFIGVFLNKNSHYLFKKHNTTEIFVKSTYIIREGPYKYTRNPMYLGMILLLVGCALCFGNIISLISPVMFFVIIQTIFIPYEEKKMEDT